MRAIFHILFRAITGTCVAAVLLTVIALAYLTIRSPSVSTLKDVKLQVPLKVFSSDNKLIAEFGEKRRVPLKLAQVPKELIQAFVATEDRRFFEHQGVDARGLARAAVQLFLQGTLSQGGSTITMQVARNFFLTRKKSFIRKINEIILAFKIEQTLTKEEILELYLNKIYLGKQAYGVAAAADVYYGIPVNKLTLAQMAMIAGLPQAPSIINPLHSPEAAIKRRKHVLDKMLEAGYITNEQYQQACDEPLGAQYHKRFIEIEAPYAAEMARLEVVARFGEDAYALGYEVYTSIDTRLQQSANMALKRALLEYDQRHGFRGPIQRFALSRYRNPSQELANWQASLKEIPSPDPLRAGVVTAIAHQRVSLILQSGLYVEMLINDLSWARPQLSNGGFGASPQKISEVLHVGDVIYVYQTAEGWKIGQIPEVQGALVALSPQTGQILALVGGFDYSRSSFNRATQAERQPGSNFKPFIYAAALSEGATLATILNDAPLVQETTLGEYEWRPQNDTRTFYGPTRLREGLTQSRNMVSIRLLQLLSIHKALDYAERFGFNRQKLPQGLSLALGSNTVTPINLAAAYASFANGGHKITPSLVTKIKDEQGKIIFEPTQPMLANLPQALSPQVAYLMTAALQDAIHSGTGRRAESLGRTDLAGKTGTTNDKKDAWYSGYNAELVATAWVGFDDSRPTKEYGSQAALPMWMHFMAAALKDQPMRQSLQPSGILSMRIDPQTGLLARPGQKDAFYELFIAGSEPKQMAPDPAKLKETFEGLGNSSLSEEPLF